MNMQELLHGSLVFFLYLIPAASIMLIARRILRIPDELFRKILHFILLGAYIPLVFAFETWWIAAGFAAGLMVLLYPVLTLVERLSIFSSFVNERKKGEFKSSMVLALSMMAISTCICWGWYGDRLLVLACVYAWGTGDAFAALVGKRFGRHKIRLPFADSRKSVEGTAAMFIVSAASVLAILLIRGGLSMGSRLIISAAAAAVCTYVELCSKGGMDTITCPIAAMAVILPLTTLLGG